MAQRTYAEAKKANPNLDKLIKNRKAFSKGSIEYNTLQNQINKAYGVAKMRPEAAKMASRPKAKPAPKPTLKGGTTPKPVAAVKKTKASIKETAQNRRKGARYEKRDAMKNLRDTTGRKRKASSDDGGSSVKTYRKDGSLKKFKTKNEYGRGTNRKVKYDSDGRVVKSKTSYSKPKKEKAPKDRSIGQGADRADRRAERKQDRAQNQAKRQGARAVKKAGKKVTKMVGRAASTLENKLKGLS